VVVTQSAVDNLHPEDIREALARHAACDWGVLSPEDWQANEQSLKEGNGLFSVYHDRNGIPFWVCTYADRSTSSVFFPWKY
jgi:hypothetical protein